MDWTRATVRHPVLAGQSDSYGLIWTAGILLRISWRCGRLAGGAAC